MQNTQIHKHRPNAYLEPRGWEVENWKADILSMNFLSNYTKKWKKKISMKFM